jgi:hypothetical protein
MVVQASMSSYDQPLNNLLYRAQANRRTTHIAPSIAISPVIVGA